MVKYFYSKLYEKKVRILAVIILTLKIFIDLKIFISELFWELVNAFTIYDAFLHTVQVLVKVKKGLLISPFLCRLVVPVKKITPTLATTGHINNKFEGSNYYYYFKVNFCFILNKSKISENSRSSC